MGCPGGAGHRPWGGSVDAVRRPFGQTVRSGGPPRPGCRGADRCATIASVVPEADEALQAILQTALAGRAPVALDTPSAEPPSGPRVHAVLAAIRERTAALHADWDEVRDATNTIVGRRPPIRHFDLHYVVTAHAKEQAAEHTLLDAVLNAVIAEPRIGAGHLPKALAELDQPVLIRLADPADDPHTRRDQRVRLGVVVTVPVVPPVQPVAPAPDRFHLDAAGGDRRPPAARPAPQRLRARTVSEPADAAASSTPVTPVTPVTPAAPATGRRKDA